MAATQEMCFICEKTLGDADIITVLQKGLNTLIASSIKRNDGNSERFSKDIKSVTVHKQCQKNYNMEKLIAQSVRRRSGSNEGCCLSRSSLPAFNFKTQCFLCAGNVISKDSRKRQQTAEKDREDVHQVSKITMKDNIMDIAKTRRDEWGQAVINRLQGVSDLIAVGGKYHEKCSQAFKKLPPREPGKGIKRGRPVDTKIANAMQCIYSYIEEHSDECQFALVDLLSEIEGDYRSHIQTVKSKLLEKYGEDIVIAESANKPAIVCFRNSSYSWLNDDWYKKKQANPEEERTRIVRMAAAIILEDIRSQVHNTSQYPPSDDFFEHIDTVIPTTLSVLIQEIIIKHKKGPRDMWERKCTSICHAIMSAARPRSFNSPLQVGLGAFLYHKFGSRQLLDVLSALGFSATYHETVLFEASAIMRPPMTIARNAFSQFVFDNADVNTRTLDGLGTFHAMGGIQCVTPKSAIPPDHVIERITKIPSATIMGKFGGVPFSTFQRTQESGLRAITIQNVDNINPISTETSPSTSDVIWLYGKWAKLCSMPGWNGFMEKVTAREEFERSHVLCLPFINAVPSDYDTIFTALLYAARECETLNQRTCFITFDQPLYIKARDIVSNCDQADLSRVIVRLGGFHLLMSYMGAIGYIMDGSGLKDLHIMTGHAYSRAVRAHILAHLALAHIVLQCIDFTDEDHAEMKTILTDGDWTDFMTADELEIAKIVVGKVREQLYKLEQNGPTAKLWVQYFKMVTLLKQFIEAERMGNWQLHLNTIQLMLPFFHASGHFFYAKSCHLYLQDMLQLQQKMDPDEFHSFTTKGYFTIRRSDKFWAGIWSDMTIEQTLMRMMKCVGGLTHGRGVTDSVINKWTQGMTALHNVCDEVERFCGVSMDTTEQHVDMRNSRIVRDNADMQLLLNWFTQHDPFPQSQDIRSLSTGLVGDDRINCHLSKEIGSQSILNICGQDFHSVTFKRKERVIPLSAVTSALKVHDVTVAVDPLLIFHRMCIAKQSDAALQEYLTFELAPFPLSLFNEQGISRNVDAPLT